MKNASLTTRSQAYKMHDPCNDLGGGVPQIGIKVKDPMCGISRSYISDVHQKYKIQVSTIYPNATFCINEKHTFYGN